MEKRDRLFKVYEVLEKKTENTLPEPQKEQ